MSVDRLRPYFVVAVIVTIACGCARQSARAPSAVIPAPAAGGETAGGDGRDALIDGQRKAVMGRLESLGDIARVLREDDPIVQAAADEPYIAARLSEIARDENTTEASLRDRWVLTQDADILIESGGDPEAVSSAGAVGVAQWMPGPFGHGSFPVDLAKSRVLTARIDELEWRLAWLRYWQTAGNTAAPRGLVRLPPAAAAAQAPAVEAKLAALRTQRIAVDGRYDPRKAITAQTRYLAGLYDRFPSIDWLFQAYHGGEAGVDRLVSRYLGPGWHGSTAQAIRAGDDGRPLTFERVFETVEPHSHTDAFLYLYGRGDDHRHYWWKIQAAVRALQLYRTDPSEFRRQWLSLAPGRSIAAVWYPGAASQAYASDGALRAAAERGALVPVAKTAGYRIGGTPPRVAETRHPLLVPRARVDLDRIALLYRAEGGRSILPIARMVSTSAEASALRRARPRQTRRVGGAPEAPARTFPPSGPLPGNGPPAGFDYHTIGAAFDIAPPDDRTDRKILTYVLDMLKTERSIHWYVDRKADEPDRWVVIAAPAD